jgi:hypothetical protein
MSSPTYICQICGGPVTGAYVGWSDGFAHILCSHVVSFDQEPPTTWETRWRDPVILRDAIDRFVPDYIKEQIVAHCERMRLERHERTLEIYDDESGVKKTEMFAAVWRNRKANAPRAL